MVLAMAEKAARTDALESGVAALKARRHETPMTMSASRHRAADAETQIPIAGDRKSSIPKYRRRAAGL